MSTRTARVPSAKFNEVLWRSLIGNRACPTTRSGLDPSNVDKASLQTSSR